MLYGGEVYSCTSPHIVGLESGRKVARIQRPLKDRACGWTKRDLGLFREFRQTPVLHLFLSWRPRDRG